MVCLQYRKYKHTQNPRNNSQVNILSSQFTESSTTVLKEQAEIILSAEKNVKLLDLAFHEGDFQKPSQPLTGT